MNITRSENFKRDQEKIQNFLSGSARDELKKQIQGLYKDLINTVNQIDNIHSDLTLMNRLSDKSNDHRRKIADLRKKIFRIIESN
jgi:hypothetical protein